MIVPEGTPCDIFYREEGEWIPYALDTNTSKPLEVYTDIVRDMKSEMAIFKMYPTSISYVYVFNMDKTWAVRFCKDYGYGD